MASNVKDENKKKGKRKPQQPPASNGSDKSDPDVTYSVRRSGCYMNPWPTWKDMKLGNVIMWKMYSTDNSGIPSKEVLDQTLPIMKPDLERYPPAIGIKVTWLGHATVLVQFDGLNILTDPIFSQRCSPTQYIGPKRFRDVPCSIHDLPNIDAVVISHNHYDHLDYSSVQLINARFGSETRWFVPMGLAPWMYSLGCDNVIEMDWWDENCVPEHSEVKFVFTPGQHWCRRGANDTNKGRDMIVVMESGVLTYWENYLVRPGIGGKEIGGMYSEFGSDIIAPMDRHESQDTLRKVLWGSWSVIGPTNRFFFAGDTGYCSAFDQIGKKYGPFDLAAIPIGAYEPRWFMKYQHVDPEEAVKIHQDLKAKKSLGIHWGTFALAHEFYLEPPEKLKTALGEKNLSQNDFFVLKHGESRHIHSDGIENVD